jgi:nucleotide-binding universal stress UspA family protein
MIRKVLIATDGSDHATKAVALGSDIAAKYDAEVLLVHVLLRHELSDDLNRMAEVEDIARDDGMISHFFTSVGTLENIGKEVLARAEELAREHGVTKITSRVEDGKPVETILGLIEAEGVDLVATGARGLSDIGALILGSVSHKLSHLSPVTCMTIR